LAETLEALLAQTFVDLEIVISDNASRDRTEQIAQEFADRDPRVKHFRTQKLITPAENHARAFELSSGAFFKFAAHDDLHAPTFVERCLEVLENDHSVVLAYSKVKIIDSLGRPLRDYNYKLATDARDPATRFGALVRANHRMHGAYEIYGLVRSGAMRSIPPQGNYTRADSVMLARLALLGRFEEIPETLFFSRQHEARSVKQAPGGAKGGRTRLEKILGSGPVPPIEWWDPAMKGVINFPEWRIAKEYLISIYNTPLSISERVRCLSEMAKWLAVAGAPKLGRDLIIAAEQMLLGPPKTAQA
jgi:glycosyltransferase involved in cell wall biosynthesis